MEIREFNKIMKLDLRKRRIRWMVRLAIAAMIFMSGMYVNEKASSHLLYEEIRQAKKIMQDHPSSIVVLSREVAEALEYRSELDIEAKHKSDKTGLASRGQ